jgi:RNA polymerase sigma factor (sigma-70 family)
VADEFSFADLIGRVRAGDGRAATELVRRYEPAVRVAVRVRLTDPGLRRILDSMDVCQSVFGGFFVRAAAGQFDLARPEQLLKLLAVMARNKVTNHALKQQAARRDHRRVRPSGVDEAAVAAAGPSPSEVVSHQELLVQFRKRLTELERQVAEQRAQGRSWAEIAEGVGGHPDALRMQFTRAIDRVSRELGLDD